MCGIAGVVGEETRWAENVVRNALDLLDHRGPDAKGIRSFAGDRPATIGAVRLRIIDLSPGADQPFTTRASRVAVAYNGEIYNFRELRAELAAHGANFVTNTDTEVLAHLYLRCEADIPGMLTRLRGMFAFAVWDDDRKRLVLARDRLGIKPLHWCATNHGLAFASESRALARTALPTASADPRVVARYIARGVVPGTDTMFAGIKRLAPGHFLTWDESGTAIREWWRPAFDIDESLGDTSECERVLHTALSDSVARHLVADRSVGIFLSGGTDSGVVSELAAHHGNPRALTVTFPDVGSADEQGAARVADELGLGHSLVPITGDDVARDLVSVFRAMDQPTADAVNSWVVCRAAHLDGLVVALSGIGGDELFAGYPTFRLVPRVLRLNQVMRFVPLRLRQTLEDRVGNRGPGGRASRALNAPRDVDGAYMAVRQLFSSTELAPHLTDSTPQEAQGSHDRNRASKTIDEITLLELKHYLADQLLPDTDSVSMAHSLEVRVPLLDDVVVGVAMSIPTTLRERHGKGLLARAGGRREPSPKRPFSLPFDRWMRDPLRDQVREAVLSDDLPFGDLLGREFRRSVWEGFEAHRTHWSRPWALAVLRLWPEANGFTW